MFPINEGSILPGLLFVSIFALGVYRVLVLWHYLAKGTRAAGRVISIEPMIRDPDADADETPLVEYQVGDRIFLNRGISSQFGYRVDDDVAVYYFPDRPWRGQLVSWQEWTLALLPMVLSTLAACMVCTMWYFAEP